MKAINIFIEDRVLDSKKKYHRMMMTTKQKFFEYLKEHRSVKDYEKELEKLWSNVDHTYMDKSIKELNEMVKQKDFKDAEMYANKKITQRSIKLQNSRKDYITADYDLYKLNPERDFKKIEKRYVNRHIKFYKTTKKRLKGGLSEGITLRNLVEKYDKMDKTIPYFHKDGTIKCYNTISTYLSMLYNWNLTHSGWNRTKYDSKLLDNHLFYLTAHPLACPHCAEYQGYVYTDTTITPESMLILNQYGKIGTPYMEQAIEGGVGHPNCQHEWTLFWSEEQIQNEKWNTLEDVEKYKLKQKIQSLDLEKSRLLTDRRIYNNLGQQDLVDKTTSKIKNLRSKIKELQKEMDQT